MNFTCIYSMLNKCCHCVQKKKKNNDKEFEFFLSFRKQNDSLIKVKHNINTRSTTDYEQEEEEKKISFVVTC